MLLTPRLGMSSRFTPGRTGATPPWAGYAGVFGVGGRVNILVETKLNRPDQVLRNVLGQALEFYSVATLVLG